MRPHSRDRRLKGTHATAVTGYAVILGLGRSQVQSHPKPLLAQGHMHTTAAVGCHIVPA